MIDKFDKWLLCLTLTLFAIYFPGKNDNNRQKDYIDGVQKVEEPVIMGIENNQEGETNINFTKEDLEHILTLKNSRKLTNNRKLGQNNSVLKINKELLNKIDYDINYSDNENDEHSKSNKIEMENSMNYSELKGVTCFRGNNFRDSASYGLADVKEKKLEIIWEVPIGNIGRWTGVGWNGQPAIVEWSKELRESMNIFDDKKNKEDLKEVIYGTLDSNIYFLDLDDGSFTRDKIKVPGPIKGSVTIDPRGIPLLYVGQGINNVNGRFVEMGYRIFSLLDQKLLFFLNGKDDFAFRGWAAFDSTSIVDKKSDAMLICGENGIVYKVKLNTKYYENKKELSIDPKIEKYRYKIEGNNYQGIENSIAVYKELGYFADNGGWLQCINLNTLQPMWLYDVSDDTDSTIVIDEEDNGKVSIYTACEVDKQGTKGKSYIRKINAFSGELIWEKSYDCFSKLGDNPNNGGALATPVVGKKSIENLIIFNLARQGGFNKGLFVALDKETGDVVWRLEVDNYSWSSPVDIYTKEGDAFIILCDSGGKMYLIEGKTGNVLDEISLGANVEGSPAVYENIAVVGTRGQKIFGVRIK